MNKAQLIEAMTPHFATRAEATRALDTVLSQISSAVASGDKVVLQGFGTFERRHRAARSMRNPATGQPMTTAATWVAAFRPGTQFRESVAATTDAAPEPAAPAPAPVAQSSTPEESLFERVAKAEKKKAKDGAKPAKDAKKAKKDADKKSDAKKSAKGKGKDDKAKKGKKK